MRIKALRKARGWSQQDLAQATGLSTGYVARLETMRHDPKLSTLLKIANAFKVSVSELLR